MQKSNEGPVNPEFYKEFPGVPEGILDSLKIAAHKACIKQIAIVGGVIRDRLINKILNQPTKHFFDLDIVIEGCVDDFATHLKKHLGESRVKINRHNHSYQTIEITIDGVSIDIARARTEIYLKPGENPKILESFIRVI